MNDRGTLHCAGVWAGCQRGARRTHLDDVAAGARKGVAGHAVRPQRIDCRRGERGAELSGLAPRSRVVAQLAENATSHEGSRRSPA